jgi:hypothetical protein
MMHKEEMAKLLTSITLPSGENAADVLKSFLQIATN